MMTIDGKTIDLSNIIIYNKVKEKDEERIAILLRYSDGTLEVSRVIYTEENLQEIIKGMKQITSMELIVGEKIKVKYEHKTEEEFPITRIELLRNIQEEQKKIKSSKVITDNWDSLPEPVKEQKKTQNKNKRKNALIAAIVAGAITLGAAAGALGSRRNKDDSNESDNVYTTYQTMTDSEIEESQSHSTIAIRDDVTYAFDVNDPSEIAKIGLKLCNDVNDRNVLLLTSGEFVEWNEALATEIVEKLNGLTPQIFKTMDENSARKENDKIDLAINLLIASYQNVENKEGHLVNIADYVSSDIDRAILNNASVLSRRVDLETVGEPVSGEIINTESEFNKLSQEYINSMDYFLHYVKDTLEDSNYKLMEPSTKRIVLEVFLAGCTNIPHWFKIVDVSEKEQRVADFPLVYYRDNSLENCGEWFPYSGIDENRQAIIKVDEFGQPYYYKYENGMLTEEVKSLKEMVTYYEENIEVRKQGILGTIDDDWHTTREIEQQELFKITEPKKQNNY